MYFKLKACSSVPDLLLCSETSVKHEQVDESSFIFIFMFFCFFVFFLQCGQEEQCPLPDQVERAAVRPGDLGGRRHGHTRV